MQEDCIQIPIAPIYTLQPVSINTMRKMRSSSPGCTENAAHAFLSSHRPLDASATYAPIKIPLEQTEKYLSLKNDVVNAVGGSFDSYDMAARDLVAKGNFDMLSTMVTARLISDWEGLCRFVLNYCKDNGLNSESSSQRIKWVFSRATTVDISMVAKDYLYCVDDDVLISLFNQGFPKDEKTVAAIKMALKKIK